MKKSILVLGTVMFLFMGSLILTSCGSNQGAKQEQTTEDVYACPMHHNITGKKGDKCSECGMLLTNTKTAKEHQGHSH